MAWWLLNIHGHLETLQNNPIISFPGNRFSVFPPFTQRFSAALTKSQKLSPNRLVIVLPIGTDVMLPPLMESPEGMKLPS